MADFPVFADFLKAKLYFYFRNEILAKNKEIASVYKFREPFDDSLNGFEPTSLNGCLCAQQNLTVNYSYLPLDSKILNFEIIFFFVRILISTTISLFWIRLI